MIAPTVARADTVTDWNGYASTAIVVTAAQLPPAAVLSFAIVQGAVYDAVDPIDRDLYGPVLFQGGGSSGCWATGRAGRQRLRGRDRDGAGADWFAAYLPRPGPR